MKKGVKKSKSVRPVTYLKWERPYNELKN